MKNQYFADQTDYIKYGLLRALAAEGLRTTVCWMLTLDDGRSDGSKTEYLEDPDTWRGIDPEIFDHLAKSFAVGKRSVEIVERENFVPHATYHTRLLTDSADERKQYFTELERLASGTDVVFFDPDNGLEVASKPYGKRDSSKYLYWHEVERQAGRDRAILIYQHFPRVDRDRYIAQRAGEVLKRTGRSLLVAVQTSKVVFFFSPSARTRDQCERALRASADTWAPHVRLSYHTL